MRSPLGCSPKYPYAAALCTQVRPEEISAWLQSYWWGEPVEAWCAVDRVKTTCTVDRPLRLQPYVYQRLQPYARRLQPYASQVRRR